MIKLAAISPYISENLNLIFAIVCKKSDAEVKVVLLYIIIVYTMK